MGLAQLEAATRAYLQKDKNATMKEFLLFIVAVRNPGITQEEVKKLTGITGGSISRFFTEASIYKQGTRIKPEFFYMQEKRDNRRFKEIYLTKEGEELKQLLAAI